MNTEYPVVKQMGERAILVQFEPVINEQLLEKLLFYKKEIQTFYNEVKIEVINTYNSLLIIYNLNIEDVYGELLAVERLLDKASIELNRDFKLFYIPVCYDDEFGWDMELVCQEKKLTKNEVIELHTRPVYTVYFLGFLPGFLYLGGLEKSLRISRKIQPRLKVEKGAVGIGENQTGIYPKMSPGGWQIIGNSPVEIFDRMKDPPSEISAGDKVKFYAVSKTEYYEIKEAVLNGEFLMKSKLYGS